MLQATFFCLATVVLLLVQAQSQCPSECECRGTNQTTVYCSRRGLTGLPTNLNPGIRILSLAENHIEALDSQMFSPFNQLGDLNLYDNRISSVAADAFSGLTQLDRLVLSHNNISVIPDQTFAGLDSLERLSLEHNQLNSLSANVINDLPDGVTIVLSNNPWTCDCNILETWRRFRNQLQRQAQCASPPNLAGREWNTLNETDVCPEYATDSPDEEILGVPPSISIPVIIILFLIGVVSLVSCFLLFSCYNKKKKQAVGESSDNSKVEKHDRAGSESGSKKKLKTSPAKAERGK